MERSVKIGNRVVVSTTNGTLQHLLLEEKELHGVVVGMLEKGEPHILVEFDKYNKKFHDGNYLNRNSKNERRKRGYYYFVDKEDLIVIKNNKVGW